MSILYKLIKNNIVNGSESYSAIVKPTQSVDLDVIIERIARRGSTTTKADIMAVMTDFTLILEEALLEGERVNLSDIVYLFPSIRGVFSGLDDTYDSSRHLLRLNATAGKRIHEAFKQSGRVEKIEMIRPAPRLNSYYDTASKTTNQTATPGNIGRAQGYNLQIDTNKNDEGIFFVPVAGGDPIQADTIAMNYPNQLLFLNPVDLVSGNYRLEVRARKTSSQLRSGQLNEVLSVA